MNNRICNQISRAVSIVLGLCVVLYGCNGKQRNGGKLLGTPTIVIDTLVYKVDRGTFSLKIHADSIAGAKVNYYLFDGDSLIQENSEGVFHNIAPLTEGYNVQAIATMRSEVIHSPITHIVDFVALTEPIERLSAMDLQELINAQDHSLKFGENKHLTQSVIITTIDGEHLYMQDVLFYLSQNVWTSVEVMGVTYNGQNQITKIILQPIEMKTDSI